jgi:hypothetical protein
MFEHTQIKGYLSLEDATAELVRYAKIVQSTHTQTLSDSQKESARRLFDTRKAGILALLDLIDKYVDQEYACNPNQDVRI